MISRPVIISDQDAATAQMVREVLGRNSTVKILAVSKDRVRHAHRENDPALLILDSAAWEQYCQGNSDLDGSLAIVLFSQPQPQVMIEAMAIPGVVDIHVKPLLQEKFAASIHQAQHTLAANASREEPAVNLSDVDETGMIVVSPAMVQVCRRIGRVAASDVTVLILGETGTGKELVARAIYQHSNRRGKPFLAVNCAAIPDTLLESELFGHEKGSFTGADHRRIGRFEQLHGGTIFLDEVGDMSESSQAKILRVLEKGQFERVGGNETIQVDVRVLAATNKDWGSLVQEKLFRPDLAYRLGKVRITTPPLRERPEEIMPLIYHFLKSSNNKSCAPFSVIDSAAQQLLERYVWPGNIRELQNVILEASIFGQGQVLLPDFLPEHVRQPKA